jgi:hypothetical protein
MNINDESRQLRRGFGMLFKEDVKKYLTNVRDIIYPEFGVLSGIILSYINIRLPENLNKNTMIFKSTIDVSYSYLSDNGFSMLDFKHIDVGSLMLFLDLIPEIGLSLNAMYYMNDINTYFMIVIDINKLHLTGYNKFSIVIAHASVIKKNPIYISSNTILNQYFMIANYSSMLHGSLELRSILMYNNNTRYVFLFDNIFKESIIGIIRSLYPKELETIGPVLNIKNYSAKIIVCNISVTPSRHEETKIECKYKSKKYPLPDGIKWLYAVRENKSELSRCKFHNYVIYFNKNHFIIQLYPGT